MRLAPSVRAARTARAQPSHLALATRAAEWLTRTHAAGLSRPAQRAFYAARRLAILARDFEPDYWHIATRTRDECELADPAWCDLGPAPPPAYDDPDRQPSSCVYESVSRRYALPVGPGTETNPAPGWRGEVVDGRFRDTWHVQRGLLLTLPQAVAQDSDRPLVATAAFRIHASASHRGNRAWFAPGAIARVDNSTARWDKAWARWGLSAPYRYRLPAEQLAGWTHTLEQTSVFDLRPLVYNLSGWTGIRVHLKQLAAPGRGRYFSGNDWVRVWWEGTCDVHLARTAHG